MATGSQGNVETVVSETNQEIASSRTSYEVSGHQEVRDDSREISVYSNVSSNTPSMYAPYNQEQPVLGQPVSGHGSYLGQPVGQNGQTTLNNQFQTTQPQQDQVQRVLTPPGQQLQREPSPVAQQFQRQPSPISQQSQGGSSPPSQLYPSPPLITQQFDNRQSQVQQFQNQGTYPNQDLSLLSNPSSQDQYYPPPPEPPPDVVPLVPQYSPSPQLSTASNSPHLSHKPITSVNNTYPTSMLPGQTVSLENTTQHISETKSEVSNSPPKKKKGQIFRKRKFWICLAILIVIIIGAAVGLYFGLHKNKKKTKQCVVVIPDCSPLNACQFTGSDGCPQFRCQRTCPTSS